MLDVFYALVGHTINIALRVLSCYKPKVARMLQGRGETLARLQRGLQRDRPTIWVHASSLGEFEQGRPLIEGIRQVAPEYQILLSFYSPSGYEVRQTWEGADCVVYMLGDTPKEVRAFLDMARPQKALFIKYDFWAVMLRELERRGVETYLVSGIFRSSQLFFKPWGGAYRRLLKCFTHLYVQDENSVQLLYHLGVSQVSCVGDTRFDRVEAIAKVGRQVPAIEAMRADGSMLLVAGSTWVEENEMCWDYAEHNPNVKVVVAPHEYDEELFDLIEQEIPHSALLSSVEAGRVDARQVRCLIIDCFGLLSSIYRYADVAFVGGGFYDGVHNTIEAAVYGIPVIFGTNYHKFREAKMLVESGAAYSIDSEKAFRAVTDELFADGNKRDRAGRAARRVVESQLGATERILRALQIK